MEVIPDTCHTLSRLRLIGHRYILLKDYKGLFAANLKKLLADKDKSQAALAKHLGLNPSTIHAWVHGKATPTFENLVGIANYLNVPMAVLVSDELPKYDEIDPETALKIIAKALGKEVRTLRNRRKKDD